MPPRPKIFRDPVHNIIAFDAADPVEAVLFELVCTQTFQRLRRIRQLGLAHLIYHGAEHSRFSHSLGVAHVARRIVSQIQRQSYLTRDEDRLEVLSAALLHDIGHGPFSHAIEKVTGVAHEAYTAHMIEDPDSDVHKVLARVDAGLPGRLLAYFGPRERFPRTHQFMLDIVSSQLDADRQDYILRDGLATGVKIGVYDSERILSMLEVWQSPDERSRRLAVSYRAKEAVEDYLIARFHMFKQVYLHKAVRAAEKMLEAALRRAAELYRAGATFDPPLGQHAQALLSGQQLDAHQFVQLDDTDIWVWLKGWRHHDDPILSSLSAGLLDRNLYKTVDLDREDPVVVARTIDRAESLARELGLDPRYTVLVDRASDTPYRPYDPSSGAAGAHIPILHDDGSIAPIEHQSDLIHLLGSDSYKILRLCVPAALRQRLLARPV
jgi:HD superfamily phosphohydrolase